VEGSTPSPGIVPVNHRKESAIIHIELSIEPHYSEVRYKPWDRENEPHPSFELQPGSPPPHVILKREYETWDEAQHFVMDILDLRPTKDFESVFDNPENEYVQVEIELMDQTETLYTKACLSIEGNEQ